MADSLTACVVEVKLHRGWGEHRPDCGCGWTGSYWPTAAQAEAEGQRHIAEG